jgi:uncharacterized protein with NRDE domain
VCLIAFAWTCHPRYALVMAANRDEFHAREALPADIQPDGPHIIGGVDLQAGGSWLQLSSHGRLAAITNVRTGVALPASARSRGALVTDFVRSDVSSAAFAESLMPSAQMFGQHTLLLWDGDALAQSGNYPAAHRSTIESGVHVLSNAALDTLWPKCARLTSALGDWLNDSHANQLQPNTDALFDALADDRVAVDADLPSTGIPLEWERRLSAAFIRGVDYGTRCSTVVLVTHAGKLWFEERRFGPHGVAQGRTCWQGQRTGG